jgi:transposase InsO family protein
LQPLLAPAALTATWALDFMSDTLYDGRRFRTLDVLDEGNREALAVEVATSIPGRQVVAVLDQLVAIHGAPRAIRCDNGPELISAALEDWAERRGVALHHIQPGKPNQNAYIERFNRTYRRGGARRLPLRLARRRAARDRGVADDLQHRAAARQPGRGPAADLPAPANHPRPVRLGLPA